MCDPKIAYARWILAAGWLALGGPGLESLAYGATVSGTVKLPGASAAATGGTSDEIAPSLSYWDEPNGFFPTATPHDAANNEFIVVLTGTAPVTSRPGSELDIVGGAFAHPTFVIQKGATLAIRNSDAFAHVLLSDELASIGGGPLPPGGSLSVPVGDVTAFHVRSRDVPQLRGSVHVVDGLVARAAVAADGTFRLESVPAGEFDLSVFRGAHALAKIHITVVASDIVLPQALTLSYPPSGD